MLNFKLTYLFVEEWRSLSKQALKFTLKLLEKDPKKRLTPEEALKHSFIKRKTKTDKKINQSLLENLTTAETPN